MFHLLYSVTNKEQYEKHLCSQCTHTMENKMLKPCYELPPINTYAVVEKEWNTKEDKGVSIVVAADGKKGMTLGLK